MVSGGHRQVADQPGRVDPEGAPPLGVQEVVVELLLPAIPQEEAPNGGLARAAKALAAHAMAVFAAELVPHPQQGGPLLLLGLVVLFQPALPAQQPPSYFEA
jgi:hypothetical protein